MHRRFHHGVTDSTNERAFAAIESGVARHGDLHVAHAQTAGRGRFGRPWHSAPGSGLYASVVLFPATPPRPAALTAAGGLAVLDAVRALGLAAARLAWPNDVMVGDAKLAGVLVEARGLDPVRPRYVLGVGINVAQRRFPDELAAERSVTSLVLQRVTASVPEAERVLVDRLDARLAQVAADPERLARDYAEAAGLDRGRLCARTADEEITGELVALSFEEGLTLRDASGRPRRIVLELLRSVGRSPRDASAGGRPIR